MIRQIIILLISFATLFFFQCRKNNQLPPETQTGANTFGCLVNGKVFKPKGSPFGGPILSCAYQNINGGYSFQLKAKQDLGDELLSIGLFTDSLPIAQGETIKLSQHHVSGKSYGLHGKYPRGMNGMLYYTEPVGSGELHIIKFNKTNQIVSGTFWFDGVNTSGEKVQVREGRFDMKYTL